MKMFNNALLLVVLFVPVLHSIIKFNDSTESLEIVKNYLPENPVVLDAGSFDGRDTIKIVNFWKGQAQVYAFEPVPEIYNSLKRNVRGYHQIKTYKIALSDTCGMKPFYVSSIHAGQPTESSSLLQPLEHLKYAPQVKFDTKINVNCLTIDEWAKINGVKKIDFLWLDMQGSELQVLKACPNILKTVKVIVTEIEFVEAYKGQALYAEMKEWLESQGFTLIALNDSYGWFGDGIFVRE